MSYVRFIGGPFIMAVGLLSLLAGCGPASPPSAAALPLNQRPVSIPPESAVSYTAAGLTAEPNMVRLGQTTKISVVITNTSGKTGNCTVLLNVDGIDVKSQDVSLEIGESQNVTFWYFSAVAGTHVLRVGDSRYKLIADVMAPDVPGQEGVCLAP